MGLVVLSLLAVAVLVWWMMSSRSDRGGASDATAGVGTDSGLTARPPGDSDPATSSDSVDLAPVAQSNGGPAEEPSRTEGATYSGAQGASGEAGDATPPPRSLPVRLERLRARVLGEYPHDRAAFTQGLLWHDGSLYESTGVYGDSTLRRVDLATGEALQRLELSDNHFAEGLARVDDRLYQLTWRAGTVLVYDLSTFQLLDSMYYQGEGWGLCFDGDNLVMSNGSSYLTLRDPATFQVRERVEVTLEGTPVRWLNELECVNGDVYANVYQQEWIARIDPASGRVTAVIDVSGLLTAEERSQAEVINGIAHVPERDAFLLTGKYWPKLFEVHFEPAL